MPGLGGLVIIYYWSFIHWSMLTVHLNSGKLELPYQHLEKKIYHVSQIFSIFQHS